MSQIIEIKVPDIGDFKDVPIIDIAVKAGDTVKAEDALLTLESDKATIDVPSPAGGVIKTVTVKVGDATCLTILVSNGYTNHWVAISILNGTLDCFLRKSEETNRTQGQCHAGTFQLLIHNDVCFVGYYYILLSFGLIELICD